MIRFIPSTVRQIGISKNNCDEINEKFALKNEETAVQVELELQQKTWINLDKVMTLPWEGVVEMYRIEVNSDCDCKLSFEKDVLDDDLCYKKDAILNKRSGYLPKGFNNLWLDLKSESSGSHEVNIRILKASSFNDEELVYEKSFKLEVSNVATFVISCESLRC